MSEIAPSFLDVWQREHKIDAETRRALEKALGPAAKGKLAPVRIEPGPCYRPELLEKGGRVWGFGVQLYGVRSERNWGIGDLTDLRVLVETAAGFGAALVGVNPLHAAHVSPYYPSSRHALNTIYLDVESISEFGQCAQAQQLVKSKEFQERLRALREQELVDYDGVRSAKMQVLELLYACFRHDRARRKRFAEFQKESPKGLRDYALYEALREELGSGGWQSWPEGFKDPASPQVRKFSRTQAQRVEFHAYLQWNARLQLDLAQRRAQALGMPIGLYFDLALGSDRGGAEVWSDHAAYATDASIGAPPDEFNPRGQDWGLPPYAPRALRAAAYRPFVDLLRANMPLGGALRLDHVMALARLYWIPLGHKPDKGGYVNYPLHDLLGLLAQESRRNRCMVIGEDLGTVTAELRKALNEAGVLSYRPLLFEKDPKGEFCPPAAYPRDALVCASTHDLPTWRGYWEGWDLDLREKLGLTVDLQKERSLREQDKQKLKRALEREGFDTSAAGAHAFLARSPSKVLMVQPEDVFEVLEQANLPGTVDEHPNWRRKLPVALERWKSDARMQTLAGVMAERSFSKDEASSAPKRVPVATYRLQLHKGFRFTDAIAQVPYLARLGVSHVYASPFLKARPGSMHGYDVIDHGKINPEIGSEDELEKFIDELRRHGMGLVLDVVPNHMGVQFGDNPWWHDVLEKGRASPYARFFDIDWRRGRGKLLLPVLGKHYGEALDDGEIRLDRKRARIRYYDQSFPLSHKTRNAKATKDPLALHRLLEKQHYRLAFWRVASDEINYRRFFEITDLAALRAEHRAVFEATHALIGKLVRRPGVDGLRVDHPDGLSDPVQYLERLQSLAERPWILVEKILADYETLPPDWKAHGTTGYRYANLLTGLFVDGSAASRFERIYQRFTGERDSFEQLSCESRMLIMNTTLEAELNGLAARLARIAAGNRRTRDYTESGLRKALAEVAARFPVYRSYVTARGVSDTDRRYIGWAVKAARRASRIADPSVFDFVQSVLTLDAAPKTGARRRQMLEFAMRFQQLTAPVVAKGVEDTAFYRYHRLIALNEVGNDPRHFGFSLKAFHAASEHRAKHWPYTMISTSTHDTKRSEDTRARIGVLSELSSAWLLLLRRWHVANRSRRTEVDGESLPSRGDEYHYYQALLGIWPESAPTEDQLESLRQRLKAYMLKAVREAKTRSSWINPDTDYEAALERFVVQSLENPVFLKDVNDTVPRLARLGMLVSLSQSVLKVASPGVPDYYQGTELFDFSLVDPDNRRPVDYALRQKYLGEKGFDPHSLLRTLRDGRAKLHIIQRGLALRRAHPTLFRGARYVPVHADSGREENIAAFALRRDGHAVIAVAPRLFAGLMPQGELAPIGQRTWGETSIALPEGMQGDLENVLTGEKFPARGKLRLAQLLGRFPVALLVKS